VSLWNWNQRPLHCPDDAEGTQKIDLEKMTSRRSQ
jgi:hypothetical protein